MARCWMMLRSDVTVECAPSRCRQGFRDVWSLAFSALRRAGAAAAEDQRHHAVVHFPKSSHEHIHQRGVPHCPPYAMSPQLLAAAPLRSVTASTLHNKAARTTHIPPNRVPTTRIAHTKFPVGYPQGPRSNPNPTMRRFVGRTHINSHVTAGFADRRKIFADQATIHHQTGEHFPRCCKSIGDDSSQDARATSGSAGAQVLSTSPRSPCHKLPQHKKSRMGTR